MYILVNYCISVPPNVILDLSRDIGDADSNVNLVLTDNPGGYFMLNPLSKQLILDKPLDRDVKVSFMLDIHSVFSHFLCLLG